MSATLVGVTLEAVTCCNCGIVFGMESNYIRERKRDHKFWTCPNGHRQHWAQQSEADRLRDQLAREKHLRHATEPHVVALARHLDDLAELLHRIEWADSKDTDWDDALDDDIRRCVGVGAVLDASMQQALAARDALTDAIHRAGGTPDA